MESTKWLSKGENNEAKIQEQKQTQANYLAHLLKEKKSRTKQKK